MYPNTYTLNIETIKLYAYRLLCLFYANKEISRLSDPDGRGDSSSKLERTFFSREMTHLLLNIAVGIRVLDDQMKALPIEDSRRQSYFTARDQINGEYHCMMFNDEVSLREVCNKIIHATTVEPHTQEGTESHRIDGYNWIGWSDVNEDSQNEAGPEPTPIAWQHLSGNVRLGGRKGKQQWWYLLQVPVFIEAIHELFALSGG